MTGRVYRLKQDEPAAAGLRRIAAGRAAKAAGELRRAARGQSVEDSVHDARKDLKKLRSVLRLGRDELGEEVYRRESRLYRDAGRALSATRDAQVKTDTLEALLAARDVEAADDAVDEWGRALERDEAAAAITARERGGEGITAVAEAVEAGLGRIDGWPLHDDSWALIEAGLERSYGGGRRAMRRASRGSDAVRVHEWRKRAKDLWHELRILQSVWPETIAEAAERLHELGDLLGEHHDLEILREDLGERRLGRANTAGLEAAIEGRQEELLGAALELGRRIYAEKPAAFRRRIRAYWRAAGRPG